MRKLYPIHLLSCAFLLAIIAFSQSCNVDQRHVEGSKLATQYCSTCHLKPEPDQLTKEIWAAEVLPHMGAMLGIYITSPRANYLGTKGERELLGTIYPEKPLIDSTDWALIESYYIENAPDVLQLPENPVRMRKMTQFAVREVDAPVHLPKINTTQVAFSPQEKQIWIGGKAPGGGAVLKFTASNTFLSGVPVASPPSRLLPNQKLALLIGSLTPSDLNLGSIVSVNDTINTRKSRLRRPLDLTFIDLDLDEKQDTIIAQYGNMTGQLTASLGSGQSVVLTPTPGAIKLVATDLNGDGHEDLVALYAQGDERIVVHFAGADYHRAHLLYRFPPSYGSADLKVVDIDDDGDLDFVHIAGDNFDYQPIPKPYHGIRILQNDGNLNFSEAWFQHLDGAYGVEAADFDGDGDQDLAAIAYFVPPANRSTNSFAFFAQSGKLRFKEYGFQKSSKHHYISMSSGDVDGDGDLDVLLANYGTYLPDSESRTQSKKVTPYVWLENLTR